MQSKKAQFKMCLTIVALFLSSLSIQAQTLDYYLPQGISYNKDIPTPKEVIGHEVGEWHVTHDKLSEYVRTLAEKSPRFKLENRGSTFEGRPILLVTVTSESNHNNIQAIQEDRIKVVNGEKPPTADMPVVIYQGFSIHGNEPSGSNAALAYAYYLAAAQGEEIEKKLSNTVILFDPSFNPDGLQRFAYWANTNRNMNLTADGNDREYNEVWPGGRTNHYWFDLNRDWLPVQLPESRARIKTFHKWYPNVLTDHHEMGTNSTFFFQPGEPTRVHPLTPQLNQKLTAEIGKYHAEALDGIGSLYYSEENYDDYYYGKGSTFPDVNGSVGILFEQGSSRGHIQESENGILTFPFTIRNQFTTALSTLKAANELKTELMSYQYEFFKAMAEEQRKSKLKGYVFGHTKDKAKTDHLAEVLNRHQIQFHKLIKDVNIAGKNFSANSSYVVPLNQRNPRLIKAMFEKRTTFTDSLFYDISAWTFPLAFNLDYSELNNLDLAGEALQTLEMQNGEVSAQSNYAYLFEWHEYYTPKALYHILSKGVRAKVAKSPFELNGKTYDYGTIMVPVVGQNKSKEELFELMKEVATAAHLSVDAVSTGLTRGIDLGSNEFDGVKLPKIALLVGEGIRSYDAGEIWHLMDTRYQIPITKIDLKTLPYADLSRYTDIIIAGFGYGSSRINESTVNKIKSFVQNGGSIIAYRNAANWLNTNGFLNLEFKRNSMVAKNISFEQRNDFRGAQNTGGAIFEAHIDRTHPINFGFTSDKISLFRNTNIYLKADKQSYNNPIQYTSNPLQSGYISEENLELIKNSVPLKVNRLGRGKVILFTDNTNFRAFWYGTNKLLANAIFFGDSM
jgi:hypothetical protein